jgi:hypothetical protein
LQHPLELATSRYHAAELIRASGLAPVAISLGLPKWPLGYELAGHLIELAPRRAIFHLPWEQFEPAYLRELDRVGWAAVEEQLRSIAAAAGSAGCVLLCFENILRGERCHRRLAAEHWRERTGQDVPELGGGA